MVKYIDYIDYTNYGEYIGVQTMKLTFLVKYIEYYLHIIYNLLYTKIIKII